MFGLFFTSEKVETYAQATACDIPAFNRFFHAMLEQGVFLAPSAYEAGFLSSAHDDAVIEATLAAARVAFKVEGLIATKGEGIKSFVHKRLNPPSPFFQPKTNLPFIIAKWPGTSRRRCSHRPSAGPG